MTYNLTKKGRLQLIKNLGKGFIGMKHTKESKKKMSENLKLQHKNGSRKKSYEKISKAKKGHTHGFKKGIYQGFGFKKGCKPWNYIDGRSKVVAPARYGDDWDKIRLLIYNRDNYTCQKCGKKMDKNNILHIHHIIPFLETFDNSLHNLITLCRTCHRQEDARIIKTNKKET